ncbi:MAG: WYL domain-containing protein [Bacteroidia bacterium]|nr:WYL domain-containing protein [Bacteroidia bacterium]MDW8158032.1 WYL domain-containing protein [Bacteroidia bacterium]
MPKVKDNAQSNLSALWRYYLIDKILRKEKKIRLEKLWQEIQNINRQSERNTTRYSKETLRKDIQNMRKIFRAPIQCDRKTNEYFYSIPFSLEPLQITKEEMVALKLVGFVLERFKALSSLSKINQLISELLSFSDTQENLRQIIHFPEILGNNQLFFCFEAILKQLIISFEYQSNYALEKLTRRVEPYLLKLYDNAWYLIAFDTQQKAYRTFRLDKMQNCQITDQRFQLRTDAELEKYYQGAIGILSLNQQPDNLISIKVRCFPEVSHRFEGLLRNQHIPFSRKIEDNFFYYSFQALYNHDLLITFLKLMEKIEILEPLFLREEFKQKIKKLYEIYL